MFITVYPIFLSYKNELISLPAVLLYFTVVNSIPMAGLSYRHTFIVKMWDLWWGGGGGVVIIYFNKRWGGGSITLSKEN